MNAARTVLSIFLLLTLLLAIPSALISHAITYIHSGYLERAVPVSSVVTDMQRVRVNANKGYNYVLTVQFHTKEGQPVETKVNDGSRTSLQVNASPVIYYDSLDPRTAELEQKYKTMLMLKVAASYLYAVSAAALLTLVLMAFLPKREETVKV